MMHLLATLSIESRNLSVLESKERNR